MVVHPESKGGDVFYLFDVLMICDDKVWRAMMLYCSIAGSMTSTPIP